MLRRHTSLSTGLTEITDAAINAATANLRDIAHPSGTYLTYLPYLICARLDRCPGMVPTPQLLASAASGFADHMGQRAHTWLPAARTSCPCPRLCDALPVRAPTRTGFFCVAVHSFPYRIPAVWPPWFRRPPMTRSQEAWDDIYIYSGAISRTRSTWPATRGPAEIPTQRHAALSLAFRCPTLFPALRTW
jgi:hypothetical protein